MTNTEIETAIEIAIYNRPITPSSKLHLCFFEGKFFCSHTQHTEKPHPIFENFTVRDCELGFTSARWDSIFASIHSAIQKKEIVL